MGIAKILADHKLWLRNEGGKRADLRGADLIYADLSGADLRDANLSRAILSKADLSGANLNSADLSGAILFRANLSGADLSRASLSGASLSGADLSSAILSRADLRGANLSGVTGILYASTDPRGYRFVGVRHGSGPMIAAGCRWFTVAEAVAHWSAKGNRDALARVNLIAALMTES